MQSIYYADFTKTNKTEEEEARSEEMPTTSIGCSPEKFYEEHEISEILVGKLSRGVQATVFRLIPPTSSLTSTHFITITPSTSFSIASSDQNALLRLVQLRSSRCIYIVYALGIPTENP